MNNSSSSSSIPFDDQLVSAIRAKNFVLLRELLLHPNREAKQRRRDLIDNDINRGLRWAVQSRCIESCRILREALSPRGKAKFNNCDLFGRAVENGHFDIVRFFIDECHFCVNYYGLGPNGATPLYFATNSEEMSRLLLEKGANPDLAGTMGRSGSRAAEFGPLYLAFRGNNTAVARLLLVEYHANPNLNHKPEDDCRKAWYPRNTDLAILHGNAEMLRMLLEHGALVRLRNFSDLSRDFGTYLNILLRNVEKSRETKLSICRLLVEHAAKAWEHNDASRTAEYLLVSFKLAIGRHADIEDCRILLEAGIEANAAVLHRAFHFAIRVQSIAVCQLLVREYQQQVDPFLLQEEEEDENENDDERYYGEVAPSTSPFIAAARLADTSFFEYFLGVWDERFTTSGGKNSDGDYPIHVVCCDDQVSLQAIQLLVSRHAEALATVDGDEGLLPFHFAANWGASLDVIFYLLHHCPDALSHVGNSAAASAAAAVGPCPSSPSVPPVDTNSGSTNDGMDETSGNTTSKRQAQGHLDDGGPAQKRANT